MNPYEVLGVAHDATPDQIKAAYRKLAMKHHPDRNGDSAESKVQFQKIQEAYDAITKPKPQEQFDPRAGHPFQNSHFAWAFGGGAEDFFHQMRRNSDITVQAAITLEQAYTGCELTATINGKVITFKIPRGAPHGYRLTIEGEGHREYSDLPPGHIIAVVMIRPHAQFEFQGNDLLTVKNIDVLDMMIGCDIEVTTIGGEKLSVHVPAGSKPTTRLRLPGKGMPDGASDRYGVLYVAINPLFPTLTPEQIEKLREVRA